MAGEIIVLITASSNDEAAKIGTTLVEEHLAACVNIVPAIRSVFFWEGKTRNEHETLLLCKSRQQLLDKLTLRVKELHSYTIPEILALPVIGGSPEYLSWLWDATKG
ncbi:MAG TPA: divalent-cation tolerance protein CutA [Nitrospirota bacterium]|nr:divalent-cation tolerance protein CutA [Nitrospirota bacterium]